MPESMVAGSDCYGVTTLSKTIALSVGSGATCPKQEDASYSTVVTGSLKLELTSENTESAAEARAKAALTTWSHLEGYSCLNLASFRTAREKNCRSRQKIA